MTTGRHGRAATRSLASGVLVAGLALVASLAASLVGAAPAGAAAYSTDQWGLGVIGAPTAWQYGNGSGVRIGIVDTGVDYQQQDLAGKVVAGKTYLSNPSGGCNGAAQDPNGQDDFGHGTHVAGIAAAKGIGVTGVAPGASLVVAKVLDCQGRGASGDVVSGIDWAVANGAKVINLSLGDAAIAGIDTGGSVKGTSLGDALQNAWNAGAIPVVAGGNNSDGPLGCTLGCLGDADYSGVPAVLVAATGSPTNNNVDGLAWYSNNVNSAQWGVAAPGGDDSPPTTPTCGQDDSQEILSTYWTAQNSANCYATDEGTSMATPFVTGALALLLGRGLSPTQAVQTLLGTANHGVSCGSACSGLVNIGAAMQSVGAPHTASSGSAPSTSSSPSHGSTAAAAGHQSAAPTSSTSSSTSEAPTTSTSAAAQKQRALSLRGRNASANAGSAWWLVLPVLVGLAAAGALGFAGRRRLVLRRAEVQPVRSEDPGTPPSV